MLIFNRFSATINPFPNKPWVLTSQHQSFENTVGKGEIACKEQFLLFSQCFQTFWRTLGHVYAFSSNRELSTANSFSLEESKIHLLFGKDLAFFILILVN